MSESTTSSATPATPVPPARNGNGRRRLLLTGLATIIVVVTIVAVAYYFIHGRWFESTEDAYANGNVVMITPQVSGTIVEIGVDDNTLAKAGQALIKLDPNDSQVALDAAEAMLARTVRQVRGLYANVEGQNADVAAKQVALDRARADVERRQGLDVSGAIPKEELAHMQATFESAGRALAMSREQLATTRALTENTAVTTHPEVKSAASAVRKAYLDYARAMLRAPVSGYVTQRSAQLGQRVNAGVPLMALVPLDQLWIDANFKETQLEHMRIGQAVEVHSDIYGNDVVFHGHVASFGIGTGSAMSLLPAQNATGNWIKIVQRVPVRIGLDAKELAEHPLRLGMSMRVEVNMHDRSGPVLSQSAPDKPRYTTAVYAQQLTEAEARISSILRANSGVATDTSKLH
jgi:membrane fusion protein, multidrug efflux system